MRNNIRIAVLAAFIGATTGGSWLYIHADESPVTMCGPNRGHDCHCPRMVQRRRDRDIEKCMAIMDKTEHEACLAEIPTLCQMVAHPQVNPETGELDPDTCFKYCKFQGLCFCNDTRCDVNGDPITPDKPITPPPMQPLPGQKKAAKKK